MKHLPVFAELNAQDQKQLIRYPVLLSLLAASENHKLDKQEKKIVVKLTHIKTFACDPVLADYYAAVDSDFAAAVEDISEHLPKEGTEREMAIRMELRKLGLIRRKLDKDYAASLYDSLRSYKNQVMRAHRSILEYFLFPLPINGLTD